MSELISSTTSLEKLSVELTAKGTSTKLYPSLIALSASIELAVRRVDPVTRSRSLNATAKSSAES